ncbi:MAG: inositol monophosphatase family protein [bacterium]
MGYKKELLLLKKNIKNIYKQTNNFKTNITYKGKQDIVTSTDLYVEEQIIKTIKTEFPTDHFHSEEFNRDTNLQNRTWLIDPIDGTSNYAIDMDLFVLQIALYDKGDIVLAFIYAPKLKKTYYAIKDYGAYLNGKRYAINNKNSANFMMSLVGMTHNNNNYYKKLINLAVDNKLKLRMLGSVGLELAFTSEGIFNIFYTNVTNLWDIYPGILLLRESGAILLNEKGKPYNLNDKNLFVCKDLEAKKLLEYNIFKD